MTPCPCNDCWRQRQRSAPPPVEQPQIHCKACDRQYPPGMWGLGPDGRRRCPSCGAGLPLEQPRDEGKERK